MENLKRYDPCNERSGRALVPGMTENKGGVYVKFSDIKDILKTPTNSAMDAISALRDLFYACIRADAAGELSAIVDGSLLDRAKDVLKQHQ